MKYFRDQYIISFPAGAAGRFVQYLLFNLLTNEKVELELTPITNSSHPSNRYTGHTCLNTNHPDIWNLFVFDIMPRQPAPRIMHSHIFPNFNLIKDRLGPKVKIIIITVDVDSILEVTINDKVKNFHDLVNGIWPKPELEKELYDSMLTILNEKYERYLGKPYPGNFVLNDAIQLGKDMAFNVMKYFVKALLNTPDHNEFLEYEKRLEKFVMVPSDINYPKDQILFLPYNELVSQDDKGKFIWLKKLEEFTNKQANKITIDGYQKYINGRNQLMKEYRL